MMEDPAFFALKLRFKRLRRAVSANRR